MTTESILPLALYFVHIWEKPRRHSFNERKSPNVFFWGVLGSPRICCTVVIASANIVTIFPER